MPFAGMKALQDDASGARGDPVATSGVVAAVILKLDADSRKAQKGCGDTSGRGVVLAGDKQNGIVGRAYVRARGPGCLHYIQNVLRRLVAMRGGIGRDATRVRVRCCQH